MKSIIIEYNKSDPFLFSIYMALQAFGYKVELWNSNKNSIYEIYHKNKPDLIFIQNDPSEKQWKVIINIPYITYGIQDKAKKALLNIPEFHKDQEGFIDPYTYPDVFEDYLFNTDILVSSNFLNDQRKTLQFIDNIVQKSYSLKVIGNTIMPTPYFLTKTNEQEFTAIAKASSFVLASNQIEKLSLINNKIYSCTIDEFDEEVENNIFNKKNKRKIIQDTILNIKTNKRNSDMVLKKIFKAIGINIV